VKKISDLILRRPPSWAAVSKDEVGDCSTAAETG
jgi:hypothetical protein